MTALLKQAVEHWSFVAPLLTPPANDQEYDLLVQHMDELLALAGENESHPLNLLASRIGDLIEAYDEEHYAPPAVTGADCLRYIMQEHGLEQADLPEVGAQSVVSEILSGKRKINLRQARELSQRFGFPAAVFLEL